MLWLLVLILLAGFALRLPPMITNRLHGDEALFASAARLIANGTDWNLNNTSLLIDKPPLFYYALASGIAIAGKSEFAARLPALLAVTLSGALVAKISFRLFRSPIGTIATVLLYVLSPFGIAFGATAFADPLFLMFILLSLSLATDNRWLLAGLAAGLALATKQSALFFLPLVVLMGLLRHFRVITEKHAFQQIISSPCQGGLPGGPLSIQWRGGGWHNPQSALLACGMYLLGIFICVAGITAWDISRSEQPSYWLAGVAYNNPGRLLRSDEIWSHLISWGQMMMLIPGNPLVAGIALGMLILLPIGEWRLYPQSPEKSAASVLMLIYGLAYFVFTWLVAFPILDRYLLPLVPLWALLGGRAIDITWEWAKVRQRTAAQVAGILGVMLMAGSAYPAMTSEVAVGGDHGANDGIAEIATYFNHKPYGTVVYAQEANWLLGYYLFDTYTYRVYLATPRLLWSDLTDHADQWEPRYVVLYPNESSVMILGAAVEAGYCVEMVKQSITRQAIAGLAVYRLKRPEYTNCSPEEPDYTSGNSLSH